MGLKEIAKTEAKISKVNEDNLILSDTHRLDRSRMVEQQSRLRTLGKRERELAKHLDYLAKKLNEAAAAVESEKQETGQKLQMDKLPDDFRNLPGIRLSKL